MGIVMFILAWLLLLAGGTLGVNAVVTPRYGGYILVFSVLAGITIYVGLVMYETHRINRRYNRWINRIDVDDERD